MRLAVEAGLARHRAISLGLLVILVTLAWAWLLSGAGMGMGPTFAPFSSGEPMMMDMAAPEWSAGRVTLVFLMWWVMMAAMMLPSAAPTILLYARAALQGGTVRPATVSFLAGYLVVWGLFSALATAAHLALEQAGAVAPMSMGSTSRWLSGAVLIAAGLYQLSPLKDACLRQCRSPAQFLSRHYRPGRPGALRMGAIHGAYCVGCCWLLMALLFVGGVMNLAWIAFLTLVVALEKLLPGGRYLAWAAGLACLAGGAAMLLG